jgi:hypothetical protein
VALVVPINPFLAAFNALMVGVFIFFPFAILVLLTVLATGATPLLIVQSFRLLPRVFAMEQPNLFVFAPLVGWLAFSKLKVVIKF